MLSTSESDTWSGRQGPPWASVDNTSPGLPSANARRSGTSPIRPQNSSQHASQPFFDQSSSNTSYFSASSNQGLHKATQLNLADPNAGTFMPPRAFETNGFHRSSRHNSDDGDRYAASSSTFGSNDCGFSIQPQRQKSHQSTSGFNSSVASRSGSLPPSQNGVDPLSRFDEATQNTTYSHFNGSAASNHPYPSKLSAQALAFSRNPSAYNQRSGDQPSPGDVNSMAGDFAMMGIAKENQPPQAGFGLQMGSALTGQDPRYDVPQQSDHGRRDAWDADDNSYPGYQDVYAQHSTMPLPSQVQYRSPTFNTSYAHSAANNDGSRNQPSPFGSSDGASPYPLQNRALSCGSFNGNGPAGPALILDRKLRGLQHEQQGFMPPNPAQLQFRPPFPNPYDFHAQNALRMNLNPYYPVPPMTNLLPPVIPRGPAKDQDTSHSTRSACLEEFRSNSKTNKRYELKVLQDCAFCECLACHSLTLNRIFTTTSLSSVGISTVPDSFSRNSRLPTAMRRIKHSERYFQMRCSS